MSQEAERHVPPGGLGAHGAPRRRISARQARLEAPTTTYAVSKVGLDADGRVTSVFWGQVDTVRNDWATGEAIAPVADVVSVIHNGDAVFALFPSLHGHLPERRFAVVDYADGRETIALVGNPTFEREVHDMDRIVPSR